MSNVDPRVKRLIVQRARKYGVDPAAALAVAQGEGGIRWGAVGDNHTSFGPFQLRIGGANPHRDPKKAAAFANSPAGIDYAIRKMAEAGAKGLRGAQAVDVIVRKFERPADPDGSVAKAVARLGKVNTKFQGGPVDTPSMQGARQAASPLAPPDAPAFRTLNDLFRKVGLQPLEVVGELPLSVPGRAASPSPPAAAPAQTPAQEKLPKGKMPKLNLMLTAITKAQQLGLRVSENPYVDKVDPVHTKGSHHYQPLGKHKGKRVGRAIDVSGDPAALQEFFKWAEQYAGKGLNDLFHDPVGYSYDRGKRWNRTIGGHGKHVHLSV